MSAKAETKELVNRDVDPHLISHVDFIVATLAPAIWFTVRWVVWGLALAFNPFLPEWIYWIATIGTTVILVAFILYYGVGYLRGGAEGFGDVLPGFQSGNAQANFNNTARNTYKASRHQYFLYAIVLIASIVYVDWMQIIRVSPLENAAHIMSLGERITTATIAVTGVDVALAKEVANSYMRVMNGVTFVLSAVYIAFAFGNVAHLAYPAHLRGMVKGFFSKKRG